MLPNKKKKYQVKALDPNLPINQDLGRTYNVPPLIIAYIRAALLRSDKKYTRESLINHIVGENVERRELIKKLEVKITEKNINAIQQQIQFLKKKIDFRQGVLAVLNTVDDSTLRNICRPHY